MRRRVAALLLLLPAPAASQMAVPTAFVLGAAPGEYEMETSGVATRPDGASLTLRALTSTPTRAAAVTASLPADAVRGRRTHLTGEVRTRGVTGGASLWLRIDDATSVLLLENGMANPQRGTSEWTPRSVLLPVPTDATRVAFGLLLDGPGEVAVRGLRLTPRAARRAGTPLPPGVRAFLDTAITLTRTQALRSSSVDWLTVEPRIRALAAGAQSTSDAYPAVRYMLGRLGDRHSSLMTPTRTAQTQRGEISNPAVVARTLDGGGGYVNVPSYGGTDTAMGRAHATVMHAELARVRRQATCGFVVDLRANTGGNMWPMLAGLAPLLGTAVVGTSEDRSGTAQAWKAGALLGVRVPPELHGLDTSRVAVLTGPRTASSGEAVAVAFRGRPNTRSFGMPTAGLSTSNTLLPLPDGSTLVLTTAVFADRTGRRYGGPIDPDERVPGVPGADAELEAAQQWLAREPACRPSVREFLHHARGAASRLPATEAETGRDYQQQRLAARLERAMDTDGVPPTQSLR